MVLPRTQPNRPSEHPVGAADGSTMPLIRFFAPLALQAASQSLTYPLVAVVASRGAGGPQDLAGLAQSNLVMFFLAMLGGGLSATGMVFGKSREGYARFVTVNRLFAAVVVGVQAILCIPPLDHQLFGVIIGLPPSIEAPARATLLWTLPLQFLFFARSPYQVALLNGRATGRASSATMGRIALTALLSALCCWAGWVGPMWAVICLTLPVALEVVVSWALAAPFLRDLPAHAGPSPTVRELLRFTLPLSAGGILLAFSGPLVGAFMARAPEPQRLLPVYYLAAGLANSMAFSASRIQSVVLAFPPTGSGDRVSGRFALGAGLVLGVCPLAFLIPSVADLYYVSLQKLPPSDLDALRVTALLLVALPVGVALRSHLEGKAAFLKRPLAVLAGQGVHLAALLAACALGLAVGLAGNVLGPVGLAAANLVAAGSVAFLVGVGSGGGGPWVGPRAWLRGRGRGEMRREGVLERGASTAT
jgi:hypothetical protein